MGRLYRSLATAMLTCLNVRAPCIPPLEAAQIGTGGQPRKASFSPVPEFKVFMQVPLLSEPKLDCKNRLLEPLSAQGVVVPIGSRLLQPFASLTAVSGEGGGLNSCQSALSAQSSISSSPSGATPLPSPAPCRAFCSPFGLGGVALGPRVSGTGAGAVVGEVSKQQSEGVLATSVQDASELSKQQSEGELATSVQVAGEVSCHTGTSDATSVSTKVEAPVPSVVGFEAELFASNPSFSLCAESCCRFSTCFPLRLRHVVSVMHAKKAWSAGAYSHGTLCGLRRNTTVVPSGREGSSFVVERQGARCNVLSYCDLL